MSVLVLSLSLEDPASSLTFVTCGTLISQAWQRLNQPPQPQEAPYHQPSSGGGGPASAQVQRGSFGVAAEDVASADGAGPM